MKKAIFLVFLLFLSGCIYTGYRPYSENAILLYNLTPNNRTTNELYYGENGYYYTSNYNDEINYVYVYDENDKCIETFDECNIFIIDNGISILHNIDGVTKYSTKLSSDDIERNKYNIDFNEMVSEEYGNYTILYNGEEKVNIKAYSKCLDSECCQKYIEDGKLYFATMNFNRVIRNRESSENRWDDEYVSSDLYSVDLENNIVSHVYSSGNDFAILYGNDKCAYMIGKDNSIYCRDYYSGELIKIFSTDYVGWTVAPYSHNKIFVHQKNNITIIDVNQ